jgi:hypothetical protein
MKKRPVSYRSNLKMARHLWGEPSAFAALSLRDLTRRYSVSVAGGDLQLLGGRWYITHTGLLRVASRRGCRGIETRLDRNISDPTISRWIFRARVYKSGNSRGFIGYGDADPSNVSLAVRGAEMRVAETRAVNRALRKAYGIGICSVEELGAFTGPPSPSRTYSATADPQPSNGSNNGQPRLKDKLCLLIREFNLDSTLVKAYAAEFCGTETLRGASRELVEAFISKLEQEAREDRDRLICKLNSFSHPVEVAS